MDLLIIALYSIVGLLAVYLLGHWLCLSSDHYRDSVFMRVILSFLLIVAFFLPVLGILIDESDAKYKILSYSYVWLGFCMYFFGTLALVSLLTGIYVLAIGKRLSEKSGKAPVNKAVAMILLLLMLAGSIGANYYGMIHAREITVKEYKIKTSKVMENDKVRIALLTDIHLGFNSSEVMMRDMVKKVNAEKPDIILIGGDLFSSSYYGVSDKKSYIKILKKLAAKEGTYFAYGNHDMEEPLLCGFPVGKKGQDKKSKKMTSFIKKCGFNIMEDEMISLSDGDIQLAVRKDGVKKFDGQERMSAGELLENADKNKPVVVLEHEPMGYQELAKGGADLVLSGHTHAGQVFPLTLGVGFFNRLAYGHNNIDGMDVIVSSGVGFYGPPIRTGSNSEITMIEIERK